LPLSSLALIDDNEITTKIKRVSIFFVDLYYI
jgi:hypothetical protein